MPDNLQPEGLAGAVATDQLAEGVTALLRRAPGIHGAALSHPVRPDSRGALAAVAASVELLAEQLYCLISTRQGERVMLPDFGLPDVAFAAMGANFARALGYFLKQQAAKYVPGVENVTVREEASGDEHAGRIVVGWTERGSNVPHNLVFPRRQLLEL